MKKNSNILLSIIIPLGPKEVFGEQLLKNLLKESNAPVEIIVCAVDSKPDFFAKKYKKKVIWLITPKGRALQMNHGAKMAKGRFLWFIHADSIFLQNKPISYLLAQLNKNSDALLFFDLKFGKGGPRFMIFNEWGVWIRCRWLKIPFGDQAFALKKNLFWELGGYNEKAVYGEDHLLVWAAHRAGVKLKPAKSFIITSPRKYQAKGWMKTTANHLWLTLKQALPQLFIMLFKRN